MGRTSAVAALLAAVTSVAGAQTDVDTLRNELREARATIRQQQATLVELRSDFDATNREIKELKKSFADRGPTAETEDSTLSNLIEEFESDSTGLV